MTYILPPRPFSEIRTGTSVASMVIDLALAHSTHELTHWITGVVAPRVAELEAYVDSRKPADALAAEHAASETPVDDELDLDAALVEIELLRANATERAHEWTAMSIELGLTRKELAAARLRELAAVTDLDTSTAAQLVLEAQVIDLLKIEHVMIKTMRGRGLPAEGEVSTAEVLAALRAMGCT